MVHIYTFCDKTLVGRVENLSSKFLCENLFKMNFKIKDVSIFCNNYDYESINFKNGDLYIFLMQKNNATLNSYLAMLSGSEIKENELLKNTTNDYYHALNIPIESDAEVCWNIPSNATAITNPNGRVQGYFIKIGESTIFVLPNEFSEFKKIYYDCILNLIENKFAIGFKSETFKTFGLTEELLKSILSDKIKNKDKVHVSIFSRGLDNDVVIKAKADNAMFDNYRQSVFDILEKYVYSVNDLSLGEQVIKKLENSQTKIAFIGDNSILKILDLLGYGAFDKYCNYFKLLTKMQIEQEFTNTNGAEKVYDMAVSGLGENIELIISSFVQEKEGLHKVAFIGIGNKNKIDIYKNTFVGNDDEIYFNLASTILFYLNKKLSVLDFKTL